jgi:hypothetical protein
MGKRSKNASKQKADEVEVEEEDYIVEKIVDERYVDGTLEYFLKWKGYSSLDNTWEPADNLDCPELLEEFKKTRVAPPRDSSSESDSRKRKADENSNTELKIAKT